jgi:hypothetical protein
MCICTVEKEAPTPDPKKISEHIKKSTGANSSSWKAEAGRLQVRDQPGHQNKTKLKNQAYSKL